jgi:hypothetical protein
MGTGAGRGEYSNDQDDEEFPDAAGGRHGLGVGLTLRLQSACCRVHGMAGEIHSGALHTLEQLSCPAICVHGLSLRGVIALAEWAARPHITLGSLSTL